MTTVTQKRRYEAMFILERADGDYEPVVDRIVSQLQSLGAQIEDIQKMGVRPFARTPSRKHTQGYYVVFRFEGDPELPDRIKKQYQYDEEVFRLGIYRLPDKKKEPLKKEG